MDEEAPIRITDVDIAEANRLSLHCPICASAVENHHVGVALTPVVCANCHTLYHRACWEQNGGKCAILGCGHKQSFVYGSNNNPLLKIAYSDLPRDVPRRSPAPNGRVKELKELERQRQRETKRRSFLGELFDSVLRAIGLWR